MLLGSCCPPPSPNLKLADDQRTFVLPAYGLEAHRPRCLTDRVRRNRGVFGLIEHKTEGCLVKSGGQTRGCLASAVCGETLVKGLR